MSTTDTRATTASQQPAPLVPVENGAPVDFQIPEGFRQLTDEEAALLAQGIVHDTREGWEIQEIVDTAVAAGTLNAFMRNEFYYEFKQGNRIISGLTAKMIAHLATADGITEVTEEQHYEEVDGYHKFKVVVEMIHPFTGVKMKRSGFSEEPAKLNGKYDRFAKQKAYTKAFRNACMKLLRADLIVAAKAKLANLVPADWAPPKQPATNGNGAVTAAARQKAYATFNTHEMALKALGVEKEAFWFGVQAYFEVEASTEMTASQWTEVTSALEFVSTDEVPYGNWIRAMFPAPPATATESDIPF